MSSARRPRLSRHDRLDTAQTPSMWRLGIKSEVTEPNAVISCFSGMCQLSARELCIEHQLDKLRNIAEAPSCASASASSVRMK